MSTTPRTPEHFPRMKHRAAGRAIRKRNRAALVAIGTWATVDWEVVWGPFAEAVEEALPLIEEFVERMVDVVNEALIEQEAHA